MRIADEARPIAAAGPTGPGTARCGCPENGAALSRRTLFRIAGVAGLATATTLSDVRFAFGATSGNTLVVLSLRGGFDGLSAVVPAGDPNYYAKRQGVAVPAGQLKRIDSMFGLHPVMAPLYPLWDAGKLAAVHAVGQDTPTRSHFAAMDEMERAAPGSSLRTGWIDRTLGVVGDGTFTGSQVGSAELPRSMIGGHHKFSLRAVKDVKLAVGEDQVPLSRWQKAVARLHTGARPEVSQPLTSALRAVGSMRGLQQRASDAEAAGYPEGGLGSALHDVAQLVKAGIGVRVATVDFGDWDMHAGQGGVDSGWMHDHLGELSAALAAFAAELGPDLDRVTLVTLSEFGRRVEQNGSGGTDHGHGNAVLVLGGGVRGGQVHGRWPGLADSALVDGDLAGTTDYRSIVAELLTKRLGVGSTSQVFPGFKARAVGAV